jgi:hypothetical protein
MDPYVATSGAATGARTTRLRPRKSLIYRSALALPLIGLLLAAFAMPAGASAATTIKWNKALAVESPAKGGISAVSCPTPTFCVAVDQSGRVLVSKKPTKGPKSWKFTKIDKVGALTGVSCPTVDLCVAVDNAGHELHSTKPAGGKKSWSKPIRIDTTAATGGGNVGLAGISCPTIKLCVAVDNAVNGNVITTTTPTTYQAKSWTLASLGTDVTLDSVSCASVSFCVAAGAQHYYATAPTGGPSAWKANGVLEGTGYSVMSGIDCPSTTLCLGVGYGNTSTGLATASLTPSAASSSWTDTAVSTTPPASNGGVLDSVSCASSSFCVAVDSSDNAYATTTPSGATTTPTSTGTSTSSVTANRRASAAAASTKTTATSTTPATKTTKTKTVTTPTTATTTTTATSTSPWAAPVSLNTKSAGYWSSISCNSKICVVVDGSGFEITGKVS